MWVHAADTLLETQVRMHVHVNNRHCSLMHTILQLKFKSLNIKHPNVKNYDLCDIVSGSQPKKKSEGPVPPY